jgi:hypothetical protein
MGRWSLIVMDDFKYYFYKFIRRTERPKNPIPRALFKKTTLAINELNYNDKYSQSDY